MPLSQVLNLYKERGETPLERIQRFKGDNPEYESVKMTYAGRLDPLAEGVLLILCGDEISKKQSILDLEKVYETEILFGFSTDSFDVLGKVNEASDSNLEKIKEEIFTYEELNKFKGKFSQKYPPYSSKTIAGKTLFSKAKEGRLLDNEIPEKEVEIYSIDKIGFRNISAEAFSKYIFDAIEKVTGDFRQEDISKIWKEHIIEGRNIIYPVLKLRVSCSSGTYIRALANNIGPKLFGIPSLALSIRRISVGKYNIDSSIK